MSVNQGDILAGKFRVEKLLGSGGMGMVVAAHHLQLDEPVAIKFLLPEAMTNSDAVGRFAREARAATKIKSEHVVRIIDVSNFDSGEPYIVMEYLKGQDLSQILAARGPLPPAEVADYVLQACEALAEAHVLGIVHRDLKPANLFVTTRMDGTPMVKVLDFGISKVTTGPDLALTKTSALMGSPLYMSPEQMASARSVELRSDIWSLGVILYELISGQPPFNAQSITELCAKILTQNSEPLRVRRPELSDQVDAVVARCLQKSPADRFANVAELAVALAEVAPKHARSSVKRISGVISAAGQSTASTALPPSSDEVPPREEVEPLPAATAVSWSETGRAVSRRSVLPWAAAGAVMVAVGVVAIVIAFRSAIFSASPDAAPADSAMPEPEPAASESSDASPPLSAQPAPSVAPAAAASEEPPTKPTPAARPAPPTARPAPIQKPVVKKPSPEKTVKPVEPPAPKPPPKPAPADELGGRL
ncbi:MAG TPA: serine/threonine-protein kinase [Polyangiaceae bacterium]|nr:serine/threonine-protein kinase [Polyangiaceae bacterium]